MLSKNKTIRIKSDQDGHTMDIVYFAQRTDTGLIKIGTTSCLKLRLNLLSLQIKAQVVCLGALPGRLEVENEMHLKFSKFDLGHEWFEPAPVLLDFINQETMELDFERSLYGRPCQGRTRINAPCNAPARKNSDFCYHHLKTN